MILQTKKALRTTKDRVAHTQRLNKVITLLMSCAHIDDAEQMAAELQKLVDFINEKKEYMIHFAPTGWNTIYARDNEEALREAEVEYPHIPISSVSLRAHGGIEEIVEGSLRTPHLV